MSEDERCIRPYATGTRRRCETSRHLSWRIAACPSWTSHRDHAQGFHPSCLIHSSSPPVRSDADQSQAESARCRLSLLSGPIMRQAPPHVASAPQRDLLEPADMLRFGMTSSTSSMMLRPSRHPYCATINTDRHQNLGGCQALKMCSWLYMWSLSLCSHLGCSKPQPGSYSNTSDEFRNVLTSRKASAIHFALCIMYHVILTMGTADMNADHFQFGGMLYRGTSINQKVYRVRSHADPRT